MLFKKFTSKFLKNLKMGSVVIKYLGGVVGDFPPLGWVAEKATKRNKWHCLQGHLWSDLTLERREGLRPFYKFKNQSSFFKIMQVRSSSSGTSPVKFLKDFIT